MLQKLNLKFIGNFALCALLTGAILSCAGKTDQQLLESATQAVEKGDDRAAVIHLKNALQKNPDNIAARKLLGTLYIKYKDGVAAEKELTKAVQLGGNDAELAIPLSRAYLFQEKYQQALDALKTFSATNASDTAWAETIKGDAYSGLKEPDNALQHFDAAFKAIPGFPAALIGKARLEISDKQYDQARKLLSETLSANEYAVETHVILGEIDFFEKKFADAGTNFQTALDLELKSAIPVEEFYIRTRLANALVADGKFDEGMKHIATLLKENPNNPIPHYLRATIAFEQGDLSTASDQLQTVLKLAPDHKPSILLLGAVNFGKGNFEQADVYLKSILDADPTNTLARKWLGATRLKLNQPAEALELIKPALQDSPSDPQILDLMSSAAMAQGDTREAIGYLEQAVSDNPEAVELRNKLAGTYLSAGDVDQAIKELEAVTGDKEKNFQSQALLVLSYAQKKEFDKAEKLAKILGDKFPNEPYARILLANVYLYRGDEPRAQKIYQDILAKKPDYVPSLLSLAKIEYQKNNLDITQQYLEKILATQPGNALVIVAYVQLLQKKGEGQKALDWLENARKKDQTALTPRVMLASYYLRTGPLNNVDPLLVEMKKINARAPDVMMLQGITFLKKHQPGAARDIFNDLSFKRPNNAEIQFYLAQAYIGLEQMNSAAQALRRVINIQPKFFGAYWTLAQLEIRGRQFDSAKRLVATVKKQFPNSNASEVIQGDLYFAQADYKASLAAYQKAADKNQSSVLIFKQHAALSRLNKKSESIKLLEGWLAKYPQDDNVRTALALDYQTQGKKSQAISEYKKVLDNHSDNPAVLNNLAWLLHEEGDAKAVEYAQKAYDLAPDQGAIADTLGWLYVQNGRNEQGLEILTKAVGKAPNVPDIRYHYAVALHKSGKQELAKRELLSLLKTHESFPTKHEADALLKQLQ